MSKPHQTRRHFASLVIPLAGALSLTLAIGCTGPKELNRAGQESVAPDSREITLENYRDRKIQIVVPPGNRNPKLSWATLFADLPEKAKERFAKFQNDPAGLKLAVEERYQTALKSIARDSKTIQAIKEASSLYGVDPTTTLCTIIGEHTFNTGLVDDAQKYIMVAAKWSAEWAVKFSTGKFGFGTSLSDVLRRNEFDVCRDTSVIKDQADFWDCAGTVWNRSLRGKTIDGKTYPSEGLRNAFFDPILSGKTYGLGQLDPLRALMVADRVSRQSGFPMLTIDSPAEVYESIINPNRGLHYVAANIRMAMDRYLEVANFDIRQNPGISATLYNLGGERAKATELYRRNVAFLATRQQIVLPLENYYGFFVNEKAEELSAILAGRR